MSVVVRMDFPDDNCPIGNDILGIGYCPVEGHKRCDFMKTKERPNWCPIICSLPEGHGRLIDADDFIKHLFTEWTNGEISNSEWCDIRQWVNEEATIVPAAERSET